MSLLYEVNRGRAVAVPKTTRKLRGYYDPLPLEQTKKHPVRGTEAQLFTRLHRGPVVPNPRPRIVDHDIAETILTQDHGMKIRIGDQSITKLNAESQEIKDETLAAINQVSLTINQASVDQITALATAVGVPVTNSITDMKDHIYTALVQLFDHGFEPSRKKQTDIINILEEIRDGGSVQSPGQPASNTTAAPGGIITPDKWARMDPAVRTIMLRNAVERYLQEGNTIKQGKDPDDMNDTWMFITGDNKKITNKDVKARMNKGGYILDLNKFTIVKG